MKNNKLLSLSMGLLGFLVLGISLFVPVNGFAAASGTVVDPDNSKKVIICHIPPGNPLNPQTLSISKNALQTHVSHHHDYDGYCASQGPTKACPVNTGGEFSFHDPVTEVDKNDGKGHVYRFAGVTAGVDARVTILDAVNADLSVVDKISGNPAGYYDSWQPVVHASDSSNGDHFLDFKIEFVEAGTVTPYTFPSGASFVASGLDIDGPGNPKIKEYVGFKGFERYYLESPATSNLDILKNMSAGFTGFITRDGSNLPGVTVTETDHMVTAKFSNTNVFYYRAGIQINGSSNHNISRFFSLNFGCVTYKDPPRPVLSPGTLRYANSGNGKYRDRILFMDWENSSLQDGIQKGDSVEFEVPATSCMTNGTLTATFSAVDDPGGVAADTRPSDMKTWVGSGFYKLYDTAGKGEAIYTTNFLLKKNETSTHFGFTIDWDLNIGGTSVAPDIYLIDAESTTNNEEQIDATTNGDYWSVIENAHSNAYVVNGLGTREVNIINTEHPDPLAAEGWSPLLLSRGMTRTTINIKNFNSKPGKEGIAFALLAPCDHGDAPASYGGAGHAFKEKALSPFKTELGLTFSPETPYIGAVPPDSEFDKLGNTLSRGDDDQNDAYDTTRNDDEDGVTIPNLIVNSTQDITMTLTSSGVLQAWFDWNADGDFNDAGEQVARDVSANSGTLILSVNVPATAKPGNSYARFRYSSQSGLGPTGNAADGEVEDYTIQISEAGVCRIDDLSYNLYTTASVAANSDYLSKATRVYQARFNNDNWQGQLLAYDLKTSQKDGNIKSQVWNAADKIKKNGRKVFTYNPDASSGKIFEWAYLGKSQQTILKNGGSAALAKQRIDWIKGSRANESVSGPLRVRGTLLGDIVHANLAFKGRLTNYGYKQLPGAEGTAYAAFLKSNITAKDSLFVGANDGMLHAIDADDGSELFAYIPNQVYPKLPLISDPKYGCKAAGCLKHEYLVDGVSSLGDAYFDASWHTVLVGTLGLGGKGIYALDVTSPGTFDASHVLWELSATQATNNATLFAQHMGYSVPAASIVRMKNGSWAAIVGNGYQSKSKQAVLFIIDIKTGNLIRAINTQAGSSTRPNGLSTPTAVDSDGDNIVDVIYAGDLLGNVWAFDVSSSNTIDWASKYGSNAAPEPLFRACEDAACIHPQIITAQPQVGKNPQGGLMVYVGSGKYLDVSDNMYASVTPAMNTFYGIHDNGSPLLSRNELVQQTILQEVSVGADLNARVTSDNKVNYSSKFGWYMDLVSPPSATREGERVISQALLREGRLIFTTMTPPQNDCVLGGKSWLMELNALNGQRLQVIPFDTNNDKEFTSLDNVDYQSNSTIISGIQRPSLGVVFNSPEVITHSTRSEGKYVSGSTGSVGMFRESASRFSGRMSWKQLH